MSVLLVIEVSPRGGESVSRTLTSQFVRNWRSHHPDGSVLLRDLPTTNLSFLDTALITAISTPDTRFSPEMRETLRLSNELVSEVLNADHIVIGTPVYNFNVPAILKAYFEYIVRKDITLGRNGEGLLRDKKATVLIASGGVYTEGSPFHDRDIATLYLRLILAVIGITDVRFIAAGGTKVIDLGGKTQAEFVADFSGLVADAALA